MHRETKISNYLLAGFSAIALVLLALPLTGPVRSFKACAVYLLNPVAYYGFKGVERLANVPPGVARLLSVDMDNQSLRMELRRSAFLKAELDAFRRENRRLAGAMGLKLPAESRAPLWAHVMERDPLHWYRSIMVDAGTDQGVTLNAPVLGQKGQSLVALGRIVEARKDSSVVLLLTNELSSAAAYLSSATLEGLIQGQGASRLRMNFLNSEGSLSDADEVYTSPTSATFPGDLLIGTVSKVYPRDPFLTFQSVEVQPALDASVLQEVLILRTGVPQGEVITSQPPNGFVGGGTEQSQRGRE